jgi:pyridoxal 5'-phosphate synthase pdxS subunit
MAKAIVEAVAHWNEPEVIANVSVGLGESMKGLDIHLIDEKDRLSDRGI